MRTTVLMLPAFLLTGCVPLQLIDPSFAEPRTQLVPSNPFGPTRVVMSQPKQHYQPTNEKMSIRVHKVGRKLIADNPEIGMNPAFWTSGTKQLELFHLDQRLIPMKAGSKKKDQTDSGVILITEGLVNRCKSDGELAALLAHELAQMVVEREVLAHPKARYGEDRPPLDVAIGNGISARDAGEFRLAELAKYEKKAPRFSRRSAPLPEPEKLVRHYLKKAGFQPNDYDSVQPLIRDAEKTYILERQLKQSATPNSNWTAPPR